LDASPDEVAGKDAAALIDGERPHIKFPDDFIASPAYLLLLPNGAAMVVVGGLSFRTHWILWTMTLRTVAILAGFFGYSPFSARRSKQSTARASRVNRQSALPFAATPGRAFWES
jgi:hypothetical protein